MSLIYGIDYRVYLIELPRHIGGAVYPEDDGTYTIYINSTLPPQKQWKAYIHEIRHITKRHFDVDVRDRTTEEKEREAEQDGIGESAPYIH